MPTSPYETRRTIHSILQAAGFNQKQHSWSGRDIYRNGPAKIIYFPEVEELFKLLIEQGESEGFSRGFKSGCAHGRAEGEKVAVAHATKPYRGDIASLLTQLGWEKNASHTSYWIKRDPNGNLVASLDTNHNVMKVLDAVHNAGHQVGVEKGAYENQQQEDVDAKDVIRRDEKGRRVFTLEFTGGEMSCLNRLLNGGMSDRLRELTIEGTFGKRIRAKMSDAFDKVRATQKRQREHGVPNTTAPLGSGEETRRKARAGIQVDDVLDMDMTLPLSARIAKARAEAERHGYRPPVSPNWLLRGTVTGRFTHTAPNPDYNLGPMPWPKTPADDWSPAEKRAFNNMSPAERLKIARAMAPHAHFPPGSEARQRAKLAFYEIAYGKVPAMLNRCPLMLQILAAIHAIPTTDDYGPADVVGKYWWSAAGQKIRASLRQEGIINQAECDTTEKGRAWLDAILATPLPEEVTEEEVLSWNRAIPSSYGVYIEDRRVRLTNKWVVKQESPEIMELKRQHKVVAADLGKRVLALDERLKEREDVINKQREELKKAQHAVDTLEAVKRAAESLSAIDFGRS